MPQWLYYYPKCHASATKANNVKCGIARVGGNIDLWRIISKWKCCYTRNMFDNAKHLAHELWVMNPGVWKDLHLQTFQKRAGHLREQLAIWREWGYLTSRLWLSYPTSPFPLPIWSSHSGRGLGPTKSLVIYVDQSDYSIPSNRCIAQQRFEILSSIWNLRNPVRTICKIGGIRPDEPKVVRLKLRL